MEVEIYITRRLSDVGLARSLQQGAQTESNFQKSFEYGSFTKSFKYFITRFGKTSHFTASLYSERVIKQSTIASILVDALVTLKK